MKRLFAFAVLLGLMLVLAPESDAAPPVRGGVGLHRARVVNPGFRAVNAVRGLGLGLGGFGYNRAFGLGLGFGGYVNQAAFVQPVIAQPVIQSYSLVQPFVQQQVIAQEVTGGCGLGVQAVVGGGCGYGLGFRQPLLRQRLLFR